MLTQSSVSQRDEICKGDAMPFVMVHMWEGRTVEQKRALTKAITDAMVEHAGAKPDHLHVVIQEYSPANWARAGELAVDSGGA
jgi:4-oxalocrotonate tautomerase